MYLITVFFCILLSKTGRIWQRYIIIERGGVEIFRIIFIFQSQNSLKAKKCRYFFGGRGSKMPFLNALGLKKRTVDSWKVSFNSAFLLPVCHLYCLLFLFYTVTMKYKWQTDVAIWDDFVHGKKIINNEPEILTLSIMLVCFVYKWLLVSSYVFLFGVDFFSVLIMVS